MELLKKVLKELQEDKVIIMQILGSIVLTALTYNNLQPQDVTTWAGVGAILAGVFTNPYLLGLCAWNAWCAIRKPKTKEEE